MNSIATHHRLERPREGRLVGGVCAGLARELGVDVTLVRIATVVLAVAWIGVVAYIAAMLLIPEEGHDKPMVQRAMEGQDRALTLFLGGAGVVALTALDRPLAWLPGPSWPFVLLAASGIALAVVLHRRDGNATSAGAGAATAPTTAMAPTAAAASAPTAAMATAPTASMAPTAAATAPTEAIPATAATEPLEASPPTSPPPPPSQRPSSLPGAGPIAIGAALIAFAAVGAILTLTDPGVGWDVVLAASVIGVGVLLVVAAPFGGARALIGLGVALAAVSGVAAAADLDLRGGTGDRRYAPAGTAELRSRYELAAGRLVLDLRGAPLDGGGQTKVAVHVGFGEAVVRLPRGVPVDVRTHVAAGQADVLGRHADGVDATQDAANPVALPRLRVDVKMGFGQVTVVRGDQPTTTGGPARPGVIGALGAGAWR
jgi:phage shock protein PspC (stress-responsive transcriptional regulator)